MAAVLLVQCFAPRARAADGDAGYHNYASFTAALDRAVAQAGAAARKVSLGRTHGGREIWAVAFGRDARTLAPHGARTAGIRIATADSPSMLLVAGTDAAQITGSEEALRVLSRLAADNGHVDSVTRLFRNTTLYVIPRVSPDACERYFERPLAEASTNRTPTDDDHDGTLDEDGPEDLDGNGVITALRVEDPEGEWMVSPDDPRLMRRAERAKGEWGRYKMYIEGTDNDRDERWNEDAAGGVDFNRNFPQGYKYFTPGAGTDPMTEIENRALADFLYDHAGASVVLVLGAQDNLLHPWRPDAGSGRAAARALAALGRDGQGGDFGGGGGNTAGARVPVGGADRGQGGGGGPEPDPRITAPPPEDADVLEQLAERYKKLTGLKDSPEPPAAEGDLASFSYYGLGRWTLAAQPWWPVAPGAAAVADSAGAAKPDTVRAGAEAGRAEGGRGTRGRGGMPGGGPGAKTPGSGGDADAELKVLKALDSRHIDALVPWAAVRDPDFPGRTAEVGGFRPYVKTVAPAAELESLSGKLAAFTADLLSRLPRLELRQAGATKLGSGVYRIEAVVVNAGQLPARSQMARIARWQGNVIARVQLPAGGALLSGHERVRLGALPGYGGAQRVSWVVRAPGGRVTVSAEGAGCGLATAEVALP